MSAGAYTVSVYQSRVVDSEAEADDRGFVSVYRGLMSRTGRTMGNVDEGRCVQVVAYGPRIGFDRQILRSERLFSGDRFDPTCRNNIGGLGAYRSLEPSDAAVDRAVERAKRAVVRGEEEDSGMILTRVEASS